MASLILELIIMVSLAIIVYLMAAAVPKMEEGQEAGEKSPRTILPLHKLDSFLIRIRDKLLRRTKIVVMKIDNLISRQLKSKKIQ
jgi:hypothetical protein